MMLIMIGIMAGGVLYMVLTDKCLCVDEDPVKVYERKVREEFEADEREA